MAVTIDINDVLSTEYLGQDKLVNHKTPLVSVHLITYNHADTIAQCLDSILMQETDFDFEVLVGEDDSPDDTRAICKAYAEKYPDKIRLFLRRPDQKIEVMGKKSWHFNFIANLYTARGKYIASMDGDDYWTDAKKLQKQVDILEANPGYSMTHHHFDKLFPDGLSKPTKARPRPVSKTEHLIRRFEIRTCSMMYRNIFIDHPLPDWFIKNQIGDSPISVFLSLFGDIHYLHENMAVYRASSATSFLNETSSQRHMLTANMNTYFLEDPRFHKYQNVLRRRILVYLRWHLLDNNDEPSEVKKQLMRYKQVFKALKGKKLEDYKEHFKFYIKRRLR
jgi:glycosyltransferase involved in cell wall biosynthesis